MSDILSNLSNLNKRDLWRKGNTTALHRSEAVDGATRLSLRGNLCFDQKYQSDQFQ